MRIMKICIMYALCISIFSFPQFSTKDAVYFEGGFESKNAFINFIVINGARYIVKQKKACKKTIISVIRDALAAYIAKDLKIAHSVEIIPSDNDIVGKMYQDCPATLLSVAPGKIIRHLAEDHKFYKLSLQQRTIHNLNQKILNKWLDETVISHMTWHRQLPIVVALDLFLCNSDRHRGNLFYDDITDSFCAIDMDNIYRRNLPQFACQNLEKMIHVDHKEFSKKEKRALKKMKKTLEFLLANYTPDKIIAQLYRFARQAGYADDGSEVNNSVTKRMKLHKDIIEQSYRSTHKLILILNEILKNPKG